MLSQILAGQNQQNQPAKPYYEYDATKGYNFKDANGTPLDALTFSQMTGTGFRKLLSDMAAKGDNNAKIALNYVGDDGKFWNAPQSVKNSLDALGAVGTYVSDAAEFRNQRQSPGPGTTTSGPALDRNRYSGLYQMYGL
jgi:hypothetical protein